MGRSANIDGVPRPWHHGGYEQRERAHRMRAMTAWTARRALAFMLVAGAFLVLGIALHDGDCICHDVRDTGDLHGGHGHDEPHGNEQESHEARCSRCQPTSAPYLLRDLSIVCAQRDALRRAKLHGGCDETTQQTDHPGDLHTNATRRNIWHSSSRRLRPQHAQGSHLHIGLPCRLYEAQVDMSSDGCAGGPVLHIHDRSRAP